MKEQYPSKARYDFSALEQSACRVNLLLLYGEIPDLSLSCLTFYDIHLLIFRTALFFFLLLFLGQNLSSLDSSYNWLFQSS